MSQAARWLTRIEVHPGAKIGRRLFIDHGMGRDGHRWRRRHAVSGRDARGTGKEHGKRHPTIENNVVVGGRAKILGNIVVGKNCPIGASSVLLRSVLDDSTVVGVPGQIIFREGMRVVIPDPKQINDPLSEALSALVTEVHRLRERVQKLEDSEGIGEPLSARLQQIMEGIDYRI